MADARVDFFNKVLSERHGELKTLAEALVVELASESAETKKASVIRAQESAKLLVKILPKNEAPDWLSSFIAYTQRYLERIWDGVSFMKHFYFILPNILSHDWGVGDGENIALDFDGIFEIYRKESRLPELFDEIIRLLESIKDSDAIDSRSMLEALEKIIATLKNGKKGSYFSLNSAWTFLMNFSNNYLWAELSKVPVLGGVFEALKKTIDEADQEMERLHVSVHGELDRKVKTEFRVLRNSEIEFVGYGRRGNLLENKDSSGNVIKA
jgi:hypothetical protein